VWVESFKAFHAEQEYDKRYERLEKNTSDLGLIIFVLTFYFGLKGLLGY
jgi:hypothetical protein